MTAKPRKKDARSRDLTTPEKLARMIASGDYRLALRKRFLRPPLVILERRDVRQHTKDLGGSGHYDFWTTTRWEPATVTYDERPKVEDLHIAT